VVDETNDTRQVGADRAPTPGRRRSLRRSGRAGIPLGLIGALTFLLVVSAVPLAVPPLPANPRGGGGVASSTALSPLRTVPAGLAGTWINETGSVGTSPPVLAPAGMAFDQHDGYAVLFGGTSSGPGAQPTGETWRLVSSHWQNLTPSLSVSPPPRREGAVFTYDPALSGVVLFGGLGAQGYLGDTWLFSAGHWFDLSNNQSRSPTPREAAAASYDPSTSSLILFGGVDASGARNDTFALTNGIWSPRTISGATPPATCCGAMSYDAADAYTVLALGDSASGALQTWSFFNGVWTNRTTAVAPTERLGFSLTYDAEIGSIYLFGGAAPSTSGTFNDSWTYTGGAWSRSESSVGTPPSPRWSAGFSASGNNSSIDCLALFGGFDARGAASPNRGQTWALCGNSTSDLSGGGLAAGSLSVEMSISRSGGVVPFQVTVVTRASGGSGPYNLSVCPGTGRCEQALAWDGATYSSTQLFSAAGIYTVSSVVTDQQGASRAATATIRALAVTPLEAPYTFSPLNGTAPLAVTFQVSVLGGFGPYTIQWNFGDGTNGSSLPGTPMTHTYEGAGTFSPVLTVRDSGGQSVNRSLPDVRVVGSAASPLGVTLGNHTLPWVGAGLVGVLVAALIIDRVRRRQLARESEQLVRDLWKGPPPEAVEEP
jgi:hypothetical protein